MSLVPNDNRIRVCQNALPGFKQHAVVDSHL